MSEPRNLSHEIKAILPFIPIMLIAGLVVVLLSNNGSADAGKGVFVSVVGTETATATITPTPTNTSTPTQTPVPAIVWGRVVTSPDPSCPSPDTSPPLAYAPVVVTDRDKTQIHTTLASGLYTVTNVSPGIVTLNVSKPGSGYVSQTREILVYAGQVREEPFCLNPEPTNTPTPTVTNTPTPTFTQTNTPTQNPLTPSATPTDTPVYTATPATPSSTSVATDTPTVTETPTISPTGTVTTTPTATVTPTSASAQRGIISAVTGGTISTQDGRVSVIVPAGAVDQNVTIVVIPRSMSDAQVTPTAVRLGSNLFSVEAYVGSTPLTSFRQPVQVRAKYSAADLAAAGGDPNRLSVAYYSPTSQMWLANSSRVWPADNVIEASVAQPALFAVVIGQSATVGATAVPTTPRLLPRTGDSVDWVMVLFLAGITSVMAGMVVRQLALSQHSSP